MGTNSLDNLNGRFTEETRMEQNHNMPGSVCTVSQQLDDDKRLHLFFELKAYSQGCHLVKSFTHNKGGDGRNQILSMAHREMSKV